MGRAKKRRAEPAPLSPAARAPKSSVAAKAQREASALKLRPGQRAALFGNKEGGVSFLVALSGEAEEDANECACDFDPANATRPAS